ncbi:MAG TPA: sugar transferase [Candidatus Eisenbacteria bacterium]|jgi:lipopolysaccharide/colanic/teichoic acid biosynthesis glycosyltransferase
MEPEILATPKNHEAGAAWPAPEEDLIKDHSLADGAPAPAVPPAPARPAYGGNGGNGGNGASTLNGHGAALAQLSLAAAPALRAPAAAKVQIPASLLAELDAQAARGAYLRMGKRALDVILASAALVVTAPIMLLAAIAIRLESRGPVLYRSTRIGRGGRPFTFLKLRSMVHGADRHRHRLSHLNECDGPVFKISRDPRMTRVGRILRVTSIDEIPQFVNVLRGDMSLVGPRPPLPEEVAQYEPWQLHRLDVRPGITCLWQISGRSRIGFQEWMRLDLEYIRRRSLALDLKILLRTIPAVLSREGAY